jgi:hypothetical protein
MEDGRGKMEEGRTERRGTKGRRRTKTRGERDELKTEGRGTRERTSGKREDRGLRLGLDLVHNLVYYTGRGD